MKLDNVLQAIGDTPHIRINKLFGDAHEVWQKSERANPGGSIKDRIGIAMIDAAEKEGLIDADTVLVEPTSGNTGIGLAMAAAVKGYQLVLCMPESMSIERRRLLAAYGAKLELTPKEKGMKGAIEKANELVASLPKAWMPSQFDNPANVEVHKRTTAQEILRDFPEGLDVIITGVGTGGHITACAEVLKPHWPNLKVYAVEPEKSPVISGGSPGPHRLQGLAAGFIPGNLHVDAIDGAITVSEEEAFHYARRSAREEGLLVGISSGASLAAVARKLPELPAGSRILTFSYDTGERYLSIDDLF